ncbi:MAG: LysR family transcriptional regulator [Zetaproteobacteria bacterium CG_4_9_14_3_um_filter_49_83]|nr:MAG: LysR family transcriptional regulator [Zetaproteobacteria bacterium CG17_big_fil_post_rev_8_21_14_2_50_50_13]PIY55099.1 MAG: LysR family transcriptional regulator [Zetaproteobacteria bacterium CG_4_10_14_0_8_um_filter_49_80]PJA36565.1 MAG: LysR family transcriptional regulator [Zetaproteobacteria bacterium CG_4_9_14_3_um_filter_49_83]
MNITLKQMKILQSIIEHQSYTDAAKSLFMTQPAVSMQIKQLEQQIGLPLFERSGKNIFPTEAGNELYNYAKNIQQTLQEASEIIEELKGMKRGKLHLTMASTANYFAPQLIAAFHHQYPGALVTLDVTNRPGLLQALDNNDTDMAIMGKPPKGHDLLGTPFIDNPLVVIAYPDHPLAKQQNIQMSQIANESFIVRESDSGTRMAADRFFAEHQLELIPGMVMNRSEAIKQAVMAELGLGIVSLHTIEMELALKRLVVLDVEDFPIMRQWHIVHRKNKRFAAIPEAFKSFVLRHAESILNQTHIIESRQICSRPPCNYFWSF